MKRIALGIGVFVVAAVALPLCLTRAEESLPPPKPESPPSTNPAPPVSNPRPPLHRNDYWLTRRAASAGTATAPATAAQPSQPVNNREISGGCHARLTPQPAATLVPTPVNPVVVDLVAAMSETKSKGAFVAAVLALAELGSEARPAIPAILRHGERLNIFDDAFEGDGTHHKGAAGRLVTQALAAIASGIGPGPEGPPPVHAPYACAAYPYACGMAPAMAPAALAPVEPCAAPPASTPASGKPLSTPAPR
jgi:hypothetical protein